MRARACVCVCVGHAGGHMSGRSVDEAPADGGRPPPPEPRPLPPSGTSQDTGGSSGSGCWNGAEDRPSHLEPPLGESADRHVRRTEAPSAAHGRSTDGAAARDEPHALPAGSLDALGSALSSSGDCHARTPAGAHSRSERLHGRLSEDSEDSAALESRDGGRTLGGSGEAKIGLEVRIEVSLELRLEARPPVGGLEVQLEVRP